MKLWNRAPRKFQVVIGDPWTINGKTTPQTSPRSVLREIYDIAVYFPITITVVGPGLSYVLEMDEEMNTRPLPSGNQEQDASGSEIDGPPPPKLLDQNPPRVVEEHLTAAGISDTVDANEVRKWRLPFAVTPRIIGLGAGAIVGLAAVGLVVAHLVGGIAGDAKASESQHSWQTTLPINAAPTTSLDSKYTMRLWTLEPGQSDTVSWFGAGVIGTDEGKGEVALYSHTNGKRIATYKVGSGIDLAKDLRWATEFVHSDEPAIGLRIAESFVAFAADGQIQEWKIPSEMAIQIHGTTPLVTNAATEKDPRKVTYSALRIGVKNPMKLTVNRHLATRAVDGDWIVQFDPQLPLVALNPVDRNNKNTTARAVTLTAPTSEATFIRHLDAGHGNALALWRVGEALYLGVHPLTGETPGMAASFVRATFPEDEAKSWNISSGMNLALIGPYAFSLKTGELAEYSKGEDFTRAYGPAAVTVDENDRRTFTLENTEYTESARIIGFTGRGTILVRLIDGSVAAYGEIGGSI